MNSVFALILLLRMLVDILKSINNAIVISCELEKQLF